MSDEHVSLDHNAPLGSYLNDIGDAKFTYVHDDYSLTLPPSHSITDERGRRLYELLDVLSALAKFFSFLTVPTFLYGLVTPDIPLVLQSSAVIVFAFSWGPFSRRFLNHNADA